MNFPNRLRSTSPRHLLVAALGAATLAPLLPAGPAGPPIQAARAQEDPAARIVKARRLLLDGDATRAQREFEAIISDIPGNVEARSGLVDALLAQDDVRKALEAARAAVDACTGHALAHLALGRVQFRQGAFEAAVASADRSMTAPGGPLAEAYRLKADGLSSSGDEIGAEKVLRDGLSNVALKARLLFELGDFLAARNRFADAEAPLREAASLAPRFVRGQVRLCRVLLVLKKVPDARAASLAALEADPLSAEAHAAHGRTFEAEGDFSTAISSYEQAARLDPRTVERHVDLGYACGRAGKQKEAEASLRTAVKLDPAHIEANLQLGWFYNYTGKMTLALPCYTAVLKVDPKNEKALWYTADIQVALGKSRDAEKVLETLLKLYPEHSEAHRLLAEIAHSMGKMDDAKASVAKALEYDPKNSRALLLRGRMEEDGEDYEAAEKSYLAGLESSPDDEWLHLWIAELYDDVLDKPEEALKHYKRYLELGGPDKDGEFARRVKALEE